MLFNNQVANSVIVNIYCYLFIFLIIVGVLITGILFQNVPIFKHLLFISEKWNEFFRKAALTVVLIRAGIGINPKEMKHTKVILLNFIFLFITLFYILCYLTIILIETG